MNGPSKNEPSLLERVDLALASRLARVVGEPQPEESAQRVLDGLRKPCPDDASFLAAMLRLRGFVLSDEDALAVLQGVDGRLAPLSQEYRLIRGMHRGLTELRQRAMDGIAPDGWFFLTLFREMTHELPRFRNNELRRGPPWDAVLYTNYPQPDQLHYLLDTFDEEHSFRDQPAMFRSLHPVRQGFRILWRFARIAPFADFNAVVAWLGMNAWLQYKGYPLMAPQDGDQAFLSRLVGGPPPIKIVQFESRLLAVTERSVA
ncbi:MAG: hypothetical protein RL398_384 [Planctomycetota bacterium]